MNFPIEEDTPNEQDPSESVDSDDSESHEDSGSGTSTSNNLADRLDSKIDHLFIQREETQVRKARYILAIMTLLFAVTVTMAVYFSGSKDQNRNFTEEVRQVHVCLKPKGVLLLSVQRTKHISFPFLVRKYSQRYTENFGL
jgi:hypothetical protein